MKTKSITSAPTTQFYWDGKGKCRVRILAPNGRVILPNESHNSKADAKRALATIAEAIAHPNMRTIGPGPHPSSTTRAATVKKVLKRAPRRSA